MTKLEIGKNDLQTYCLENNLEYLLDEWHPTKNGELKPCDVTYGSGKKVWWLLPYDDSKTGKHFDFEWKASISSRAREKNKCPYLSGRAVWTGFNDLATINPTLAKQWHPTKNGTLKSADVSVGINKKVWWYLPYNDPKTGKHFDFEWQATIASRTKGNNCPYITGKKVWIGFNDLATINPKLTKEWHPTKNGNLKPSDVTVNSGKKVWWYLPYDDFKTGKHFNFEWEASIDDRTKGRGDPFLSGKAVWKGFNDLATTHPELAKQWHPTKNGDLKPFDVTYGSNKKVWWKCQFNHSYRMKINMRTSSYSGCPICAKEFKTSFPEQTIFYYIKKCFSDVINGDMHLNMELDIFVPSKNIAIEYDGKQWHKDIKRDEKKNKLCKNNNITLYRIREDGCPNMAETEYTKIIPCKARDEMSLKNAILDLRKQLSVSFDVDIDRDRQEIYSQYIKSKKENSLANKFPELAKQWHPTKNGDLKPTDVTYGSGKIVWWLFPYNDPKTGKYFIFEWEEVVSNRTSKSHDCPYLSNHKVLKGFNDLATTYPELAKQWHPTKNGDLKPTDVSVGNNKKVWWYLPYNDPKTGMHFDFEWEATIASRTSQNLGCPYLSGYKVWTGFNDLKTTYPELAKEWHPAKNGDLAPENVSAYSNKKIWWLLPYDDSKTGKHFDFEWQATISGRTKGKGCPYLSGRKVWIGFNDLATTNPTLAKQWHPTKNGDLKPTDISAGNNKKVWWYLPYNDPKTGMHFDFEWEATIVSRTSQNLGCPYLSGQKIWQGFNDLATTHPELAKEWHPTKNGNLKPTDVIAGSDKKVWWIDENNHEYQQSVRNKIKRYKKRC